MSSNRRRGRNKDRLQKIIGIAMIIVVLGVFAIMFVALPDVEELDEVTMCPTDGAKRTFAFLIDRTDSFSAITRADILHQILQKVSELGPSEEVLLFGVDEIGERTLEPIIQVCNPGSPESANPLLESKAIMERNWVERFERPLRDELLALMAISSADTSPILESAQSLSVTHLRKPNKSASSTNLVVISDFLQNSNSISFYREAADYRSFRSRPISLGLNPDFRGVEVELWLIQRPTSGQGDGSAELEFFSEWVNDHGGRVVRLLRLSGSN